MARLLVVEDNPTNLELMLYLLRAYGHEAHGITESRNGLEAARRGGYDLVLADMLMPDMDGLELARVLKATPGTASTPLVAVTAQAMVGDRKRALAAGFDGYIAKPIDPEQFVAQIESFLPEHMRTGVRPSQHSQVTAAGKQAQSGPVILVVDDMQANFHVVRGALEPLGYRVVDTQYPAQAVDVARAMRPALILCDVHMPGFDGFEVIELLRADPALRAIPFIFMSSTTADPRDELRGLELGASRFITRPIEASELAAIVRQYAGAHQTDGQHPRR